MGPVAFVFPALSLCFCVALFLYLTRHSGHWKRKRVECLSLFASIASMWPVFAMRQAFYDRIKEIHLSSASRFTGFFLFDKPALIVRDLDLMKRIFVKDFAHFVDRDFSPDRRAEPVLAHGLFGLKGVEWRALRAKISPCFTSGRMRSMFRLVRDCCVDLETLLARHADAATPCDVKDVASRFTTDAIATCAFGIEGRALRDPDWVLRRICARTANPDAWTSFKAIVLSISPWTIATFRVGVLPTAIYNAIREIIWGTVERRERDGGAARNDFLDTLLELRRSTREEKKNNPDVLVLDGDVLIAQTFTFLIAGFETSSTTMSLALYEMALRPDVQRKARDEVRRVLAKYDGALTYDALQDMRYLGQVFYETLRKYPVLPFLDRLCTNAYKVPDGDLVIERGTRVFFSMSAIQNDPDNFPDPDAFDPDRFADERADAFHRFSFLPFGEGPRNCVGMRFGIMQSKAGLATLLSGYEVEPCAATPCPPAYNKINIALSIAGRLPLAIKRAD